MELIKPTILTNTKISNLIFQRKDIYCLLESLIKSIGINFENLGNNDQTLKAYTDDLYNDLSIKILEISSGESIDHNFIPRDGSVTIDKLAEEVINFIQSKEYNIEIDSINNLLIDKKTGLSYKLVRADAEPIIQYGEIEITEFEYQTNISPDGIQSSMVPTKLSFRQKKTTINPYGSVDVEYIYGDKQTSEAIIEYSIENKPDWFKFIENNGTVQIFSNPTEQLASATIKAKVTWNGQTSEYKQFVITQQAGYIRFSPDTIDVNSGEHELITINIINSKGITVNNVSINVDWADVIWFADDKIQLNISDNKSTSPRTAVIYVQYNENKSKTVSVKQSGKQVITEFYYGGAANVNEIPTSVIGLNKTTSLEEFLYIVNGSDGNKCIFINVPNGYAPEYIKDPGGNIKTMSPNSPITNGDRKIYFTEQSAVVPLSGTFKIKINKL